jgi:branched-chain amino acid transport system permease protein
MIGLSYELFLGYQDQYFSALGVSFANVMPYLVMIIVLMVRPWGLFGTRDVRRV